MSFSISRVDWCWLDTLTVYTQTVKLYFSHDSTREMGVLILKISTLLIKIIIFSTHILINTTQPNFISKPPYQSPYKFCCYYELPSVVSDLKY